MRAALRLVLLLGLTFTLRAAPPALTLVSPERTLVFTAAEFAALPHMDCTVTDPHSNQPRRYTGVAVHELLSRLDAPLGPKLRGPALGLVVVARASDGYSVVFGLADFDEAFSDRTILLADREDGQPLPANAVPFRIIVPGDKKAARWARMVTTLELVRVAAVGPGHTHSSP